ncbi:MAG: cell division protein ZipA [Ferrimonas sp.]
MDDLRIIFLIVGSIAIIVLMWHGLMSVRKNKQKPQNRRLNNKQKAKLAATPVLEAADQPVAAAPITPVQAAPTAASPQPTLQPTAPPPADSAPAPVVMTPPDAAPNQPIVEPAPVVQAAAVETPEMAPPQNMKMTPPGSASLNTEVDTSATMHQQESVPQSDPVDVLVLFVVGSEPGQILGKDLLQNLNEIGFKYGDMNIFHHHQHVTGNGPVLYSLANMMQPGTFDLDTINDIAVDGVLLFLTLPSKQDARVVFSMMLGNAQRLADNLGGQVLDDKHQPWSEATQEQYMQRIIQAENT